MIVMPRVADLTLGVEVDVVDGWIELSRDDRAVSPELTEGAYLAGMFKRFRYASVYFGLRPPDVICLHS